MANAITGGMPLPAILMEEPGAANSGSIDADFPLADVTFVVNSATSSFSVKFPLADVAMSAGARGGTYGVPVPAMSATGKVSISASIAVSMPLPEAGVDGYGSNPSSMSLGFPLPVISFNDNSNLLGSIAAVFVLPSTDVSATVSKVYNPRYERDSSCI